MSPSLKRNGYCWGMVGVNGAKTRAHVVSLRPCLGKIYEKLGSSSTRVFMKETVRKSKKLNCQIAKS